MNAFRCFRSPWGYVQSALLLFIHKKQALEVRQPQPLCDHPEQKLSRQEHPKTEWPSPHPGRWTRAPAVAPPLLSPLRGGAKQAQKHLLSGAACSHCQLANTQNSEAATAAGGLCVFQAVLSGREVPSPKQSCLCFYDRVQPPSHLSADSQDP